MTSMPALERLRRLLAIVPWVVEQDGPLIDEVAARFDYDRDELLDDLEKILGFRDELSSRIALMGEILATRDEDRARAYIERGDELRRGFDSLVNELVHATSPALVAVPRALLYRFLKRVTAHCANVVTAVIMPVDRLDYFDEDFDTRG